MMDEFTAAIQNYLRDKDELDAAKFLDGCVVENRFKDLVFGMDGNDEAGTELYDIIVFVPVKRYHQMESSHSKVVDEVQKGISEYAEASGRIAYSIQWKPYLPDGDQEELATRTIDVVKLLNDNQYVTSKLQILRENIDKAPHVAIGTAKELVEICCKGILSQRNVSADSTWDVPRLVKETNKVLKFSALENDAKLQQSINMVTSGLANIIHGVTEIRNRFGSGHGHDLNFKELDAAYTHLVVFSSIEFITFYLRVFHSQNK